MSAGMALDELERDALTEIVNIGVSRAAAGLRKMVGQQVLLSVPAVEIVTYKAAAALIGQRESEELIAVRQEFGGAFSGRALLIFPGSKSSDVVRAVAGGDVPADDLPELETEVLAEIGNVILNNCLGTMANMLQQSLTMSLPNVVRGSGEDLFSNTAGQPGDAGLVLFLYINFSLHDCNIRGYIAMLMDLPSLSALRLLIADFIARVTADTD